jgi:hypothetical protein
MANKPLISTEWQDQWIAENYPDSAFWLDPKNSEVIVFLGVDEDGASTV